MTVFDGLQLAKKVSGKPGWKGNGTRLFGSIQRKISWSKGTSEKVVLFFRTECFKRKFVFHFFKAMLPVLCLRCNGKYATLFSLALVEVTYSIVARIGFKSPTSHVKCLMHACWSRCCFRSLSPCANGRNIVGC